MELPPPGGPEEADEEKEEAKAEDTEIAEVFMKAQAGAGKRARNLLLSPHAAGKSAKTEEEKAAIRDIVRRDNDEAAHLIMPLKMARTLMQTGLVTDPEFERDCEGLTKEDRRLKEEERNKARNLYRPEWVKSMRSGHLSCDQP